MSATVPSASAAPSPPKSRRPPIHYRFVSIDQECPPFPSAASSPEDDPECFSLLRQFYDDLMVPTFPLEEERDDLEDWLVCFRAQRRLRRHRNNQRRSKEVEDILILELKEEGIASRIRQFATDADGDEEEGEDCEFQGPAMDVVLMVQEEGAIDSDRDVGIYAPAHEVKRKEDMENSDARGERRKQKTIIGGAAVEYYKQSRVGLLGYVVLHGDFRGRGLAGQLHREALCRLEALAEYHSAPAWSGAGSSMDSPRSVTRNSSPPPRSGSPLRAVFAETNTPAAGDVTFEQCLSRHKSLFNLGYRHVGFPYAQPPLSTEDVNASFDDMVLLVYFPFDEIGRLVRQRHAISNDDSKARTEGAELMERFCPWFLEQQSFNGEAELKRSNTVRMNADIPFQYVEDFYQSVFGYCAAANDAAVRADSNESSVDGKQNYRTADYYQLACWFCGHRRDTEGVEISLLQPTPWEDFKGALTLEMKEWKEVHQK